MVTVVGDLRSQFIVVARPTGIHNVARVEAGLSWFFCDEGRELCVIQLNHLAPCFRGGGADKICLNYFANMI